MVEWSVNVQMANEITLWEAKPSQIVPTSVTDPVQIAPHARQLSRREVQQIVQGFKSASYEMVSTFIWTRTISALKKQLASLGMEFIGEMLARPDISESSSV